MKEFNLSNRDRILIPEKIGESYYWRKEKDIKEFIKELKEKPLFYYCSQCKSFYCYAQFHKKVLLISMEKLDKLAGEELI